MKTSLKDYGNTLIKWYGCNSKNQKNDSPMAFGLVKA